MWWMLPMDRSFENAQEYLLRAIEIADNYSPVHAEYAAFLRIDIKDFDQAKIYFEKAIELDSNNADAYYEYGRMLRDMKLYDESEKYYLRTIEIMGNDVEGSKVYGSYAFLLHLMGDNEKAKKYIEIQMNLDARNQSHWQWFYYGLIVKEKEDESLMKAVDGVRTTIAYDDCLASLKLMDELVTTNNDYYNRFKTMLQDKFETRWIECF